MKFWSDVEKEYNELLGDTTGGNDNENDEDSSVGEYNELMSDIKKDVKKIPKSEVFPSFSSKDKAEEHSREDESDLEQEGGRRTYSRKSKKNKKCTIRGKTYEIGDRWRDEKTGKDMMCILMNVPKSVQPLLADVDILSPKPSAENETEWKRPSVEPQWSYTATPKRKDECQEVSSGKSSEKPDNIESLYEEGDKSSKYQTESNKDQLNELEPPNNHDGNEEESNEAQEEIKELRSENQTDKEPEIVVVDQPEPVKEDADNRSEDEDRFENVADAKEKEAKKEEDEEESGEGSDSEVEQDSKKAKIDTKDKSEEIKSDEPTDKNNTSSSKTETTTANYDPGSDTTRPQHDKKDSNISDKNTKADESKTQDNAKTNNHDIADSQDDAAKKEKGEPIYTKETVVVQRKLIKTEKTIETTETEKNKK